MAITLPQRNDTSSPRLLDAGARPIPQRVRAPNLGVTRGGASFTVHGGYVADKERNAKLTGTQRYVEFDSILADTAIVAAGVRYFLNLSAKTPWNFRPANDTPEAKDKADFLKKMIEEMKTPWPQVIKQACMHRLYGFSTMEWTAERLKDDVGSYRVSHIENRAAWTIIKWDTDFAGRVRGCVQRPPQDQGREIYLPRAKLLYMADKAFTDDPRGVGLLRHVIRAVQMLKSYETLEHAGFNTDMRGIPVARAPLGEIEALVANGDIEAADAELIKKPLYDFVTNHLRQKDTGILLDSSVYAGRGEDETPIKAEKYGIELLSGGSYGHKEIAMAIERLNREIARVLGVEQILLGADVAGSQALSRDKSQAFFMVVNSALEEIRGAVVRDIINPVWELNGFDDELKPEVTFDSVEFKDPEQISKVVKDLATSGVPIDPEDDLVTEMLGVVGMPPLNQALREEKLKLRIENAKLGIDEFGFPLPGGNPFEVKEQGSGGSGSGGGKKSGDGKDPSKLSGNLKGVDPGGSADDSLRARQGREASRRSQARAPKPKKPGE